MNIVYKDYGINPDTGLLPPIPIKEWEELRSTIEQMPLHLKASDQSGKQGSPIFDPVGTNECFEKKLLGLGWQNKIAIPAEYNFLGKDIDFEKNGVLVEVQFSNYPFLLNNLLRTELFFRARLAFGDKSITSAIIITKGGMFPSSNSTLYYEQALHQLDALNSHGVFSVPIRLVGLIVQPGPGEVTWTDYSDARYSRTISNQRNRKCEFKTGRAMRHGNEKCLINFEDQ